MRSRSWFVVLLLLVPGWSCGGSESIEWQQLLQRLENEFPEVPRLGAAELEQRLAESDGERPLLIDARSVEEFAVSHLPGAVRAETVEEVRAAPGYTPTRTVVIYCSVGYRSSHLARGLLQEGHGDVYNLEGSIFRWANQGRPLERSGRRVKVVHPFSESWGLLLDEDLWQWRPES